MKKIILITALMTLTGCATCSDGLDADLHKYSEQIAMAKYSECRDGRISRAAAFKSGMDSIANNYGQRANAYNSMLPRNNNINIYGN